MPLIKNSFPKGLFQSRGGGRLGESKVGRIDGGNEFEGFWVASGVGGGVGLKIS